MASTSILSFPDTYKRLAEEITKVLDRYQEGELSEEAALEAMATWRTTVPFLLFSDDRTSLHPSLSRIIGKRRANVVMAMLAATKQ